MEAPLGDGAPLAPLALYRRYRPETFAEVIGQDHVTEPLRHALAGNRAHHAYLFSGPRGCGKTTSARILARALNCERAPVAEPCGTCPSCRDLARGGPGSIDVIEIDAASHGGVDDARDLRERAFFTPVSSRYKVYVIDEAHMVSTQGFNALLKLVEEPPPHLKFVFATTEPDKVIGTIRSRTHHYPFRLVPPRLLTAYLSGLCEREGVQVEPTALPLVVRAGGGSVRDTLSVLDQLIGGAGEHGVTYAVAAGLLGYTPDWLLDEVVDAFAAGDGASVFGAVDKVVETGQDPRRFAEDLLQRLRDLIIVSSVPDAAGSGVLQASADLAERLEGQASRFGVADLTRSAEVVSAGLDQIRGATAPRLLLELICARVLLPGADASPAGVQARLDRLERRIAISTEAAPGLPEQPRGPAQAAPAPRPLETQHSPPQAEPTRSAPPTAAPSVPSVPSVPETPPAPLSGGTAGSPPPPEPTSAPGGALGLAEARHAWPTVLAHLRGQRRLAWMLLSRDSHVVSVEASMVTVSLPTAGARDAFTRCGGEELLRQSMIDVLGVDWGVEAVVEPAPSGPSRTPPEPTAPDTTGPPAPGDTAWPDPALLGGPPEVAQRVVDDAGRDAGEPTAAPSVSPPRRSTQARAAIRSTREARLVPATAPDADARADDADLEDDGLQGTELLASRLGAQVIEEIPHDR